MQNYERAGTLNLCEVLPLIPERPKEPSVHKFFGHKISLATKRLRVFAVKGVKCRACGLEGSFFAIERHRDCGGNQNPRDVGGSQNPKDVGVSRNHGDDSESSSESNKEVKFRPNLYAVDDVTGEEVMITIDHIQPKALGGNNNFSNLQPMCEHCNFRKGCDVPSLDVDVPSLDGDVPGVSSSEHDVPSMEDTGDLCEESCDE